MENVKYSNAEIQSAVCAVMLMRSSGVLPDSNAATFLGYVTDYLLDEWQVTETNDRWNALFHRLEVLYPHLKDVR